MNTNCFSPKTFCRVMNKAGERGLVYENLAHASG
jgi:hypothetical protein